ncbi:major facilitator superfamily domain-containing protein [Hyaloraphidium curvatum]|nr:major facilitator superfamily domain-containing protein [Hyaloraphidium curvatum]
MAALSPPASEPGDSNVAVSFAPDPSVVTSATSHTHTPKTMSRVGTLEQLRLQPVDDAIPGLTRSSTWGTLALEHAKRSRDDDAMVEAALAGLGFGRYHWRLFWTCSMGWFNDAFWFTCVAYIQPILQEQFGVSSAASGLMITLFNLGAAVGEIIWSFFAALKGRRITFGLTLGLCGASGILMAVMPNFALVCIAVVLLGMSYGGNVAVDTCLFLEWVPRVHGSKLSYMNMLFTCGSVVPSVLAWALLPLETAWGPAPYDNAGWRYYVLTLAILNLIMLAMRRLLLRLHETPYWLVSKGRYTDALDALRNVAEYNKHAEPIVGEEKFVRAQREEDALAASRDAKAVPRDKNFFAYAWEDLGGSWAELKKMWREHIAPDEVVRRNTTLLMVFWTIVYYGWVGFNSMVAVMLSGLGLTDESDTYRDLIIYTVAAIPSAVVARYLLDWKHTGRVGALALGTELTGLSLLGFGIVAVSATYNADGSRTGALRAGSIVTTVAFNATQQICMTALWLYTPELFRTAVRVQIFGAAMSLGRISSVIAPLISGSLLTINVAWRNAIPPFVSFVVLTVAAIIALFLPIETLPGAVTWRRVMNVAAEEEEEEEAGGAELGSLDKGPPVEGVVDRGKPAVLAADGIEAITAVSEAKP